MLRLVGRMVGLAVVGAVCAAASGCWSRSDREVIVYSALDSEFSEPIFEDFTRATGIAVRAKFDTEATKTVGLANAILAERERPRCDVFWNNEILNTLRLQKEGLLEAYACPRRDEYPSMYRSPKGLWYGFAARARVLVVNTKAIAEGERPTSIRDLAEAKWRGKTAMAKPLFGTTATHAACLFAYWGDEKAKEYYRSLKKNEVQVLSGNKQVALAVAAGEAVFGITDTDDAIGEQEKGAPLVIVYPDQGEDGMGTLFIPNTVAIVAGAAHGEAARQLVDYVLSPEVEAKLAAGPSAQIPLNREVQTKARVATPETVKAMQVRFEAAADKWDEVAEFLGGEFTGR